MLLLQPLLHRLVSKRLLDRVNFTAFRAECSQMQNAQTQSECVELLSEHHAEVDENKLYYKLENYAEIFDSVGKKQLRSLIRRLNSQLKAGDENIPKHLTSEQISQVLELTSWNKRRRLLRYIANKQLQEYRKKHPRSPKKFDAPVVRPWQSTSEVDTYGLFRNTIFTRMPKSQMYSTLEKRLVYSMPFAQKVGLDFAYDHLMSPRERNKVQIDVKKLISRNRWSPTPLNIFFCNFDDCEPESTARLVQTLTLNRKTPSPLEVTPKSVCEMFPRQRVVYLSPEGDDVLDELDSNIVYVLGAFVDKTHTPGASAQRAKQLGVRSMRFPAKVFLRWSREDALTSGEQVSQKPLHLTHCVKLLLSLASGASWQEAIQNVDKNLEIEL